MAKTILQIPIDKTLRDRAAAASSKLGFSSLQESVRLYLHKLAENKLTVNFFEEPPVQLSPRAARRYDKMIKDIESGREPVYVAHSVDELMDQLRGRSKPVPLKIVPKTLPKTHSSQRTSRPAVSRAYRYISQ